jgi:hypothetical protein
MMKGYVLSQRGQPFRLLGLPLQLLTMRLLMYSEDMDDHYLVSTTTIATTTICNYNNNNSNNNNTNNNARTQVLSRLEEIEDGSTNWGAADKAALKALRGEEARRMWLLAAFQRYPHLCPTKGVPLLLCERLYLSDKKKDKDLQPFECRLDAIGKGEPMDMHAAPPPLEAVEDITPKLITDWSLSRLLTIPICCSITLLTGTTTSIFAR